MMAPAHPRPTVPKLLRLQIVVFLVRLGFTKRDIMVALRYTSINAVKDDLSLLRKQKRSPIPPDLVPASAADKLRNVIASRSHLEQRLLQGHESEASRMCLETLDHWLSMQRPTSARSSFSFPTLLNGDGTVLTLPDGTRRKRLTLLPKKSE